MSSKVIVSFYVFAVLLTCILACRSSAALSDKADSPVGPLGQTNQDGIWFGARGFGAGAAMDNCAAFQKVSAAVQAAGGGTVRIHGNLVTSCALSFTDVAVEIQGDGHGQSALTFTSVNNAGIRIKQDNSYYRVGVRGLRLYSSVNQPTYQPAISVTFPSTNSPDASAIFEDVQVDSYGTSGYFSAGIACTSCGHAFYDHLDIQGLGPTPTDTQISSNNMTACLLIRGYSSSSKVMNVECTAASYCLKVSGDTEGMHTTGLNCVATNHGIYYDDYAGSNDPASNPHYPVGEVEQFFCDCYMDAFVIKGWDQANLHNFNFYKRSGSNADWSGINFIDGVYRSAGGRTVKAGTIHSKAAFGRCASNPSANTKGAVCATIGPNSAYNDISDISPDGMTYFVNEGNTSTGNYVTNNHGFPVNSVFYANNYSIKVAWRTNPSPRNFSRDNRPAVLGSNDSAFQTLDVNSTTPNVGGFNLLSFHTANTSATTIINFANGMIGDTIRILAGDGNTIIADNATIATKSGAPTKLIKGRSYEFYLDGPIWRQD